MRFVNNSYFREGFFDWFQEPVLTIVNDNFFILKGPNEDFLSNVARIDVKNNF